MRITLNELQVIQLLQVVAQGFKKLQDNPDLEQIIKDTYALSESEQKAAEEARAMIGQVATLEQDKKEFHDKTVAFAEEQKKAQDEIQAERDHNTEAASANVNEKARLETLAGNLKKLQDKLVNDQNKLGDDQIELKRGEAKLAADQRGFEDEKRKFKTTMAAARQTISSAQKMVAEG